MEPSEYDSQVFQTNCEAENSGNCCQKMCHHNKLMSTKCHSTDVKFSPTTSGRCYTENRNRLRRTLIYLLIFLIPLAVEVAAAAASAELHRTRHMASRRHGSETSHDNLRHRRFSDLIQNGSVMHPKRLPEMYSDDQRHTSHLLRHSDDVLRHRRFSVPEIIQNGSVWPAKRVAEIYGDIVIGGLHMIHEREDAIICGPVMPQGGLQA